MAQVSVNLKKQTFELIRKQYPQKLIDDQSKSAILIAFEFHKLYHVESIPVQVENQKVLDSNDKNPQSPKIDEKAFQKDLMDAIKIIVQAYQKNQSIRQKYQFQHVEEIVQKTKLTLKQLLKIKPKQSKSITNPSSKPQQTNKLPQQKAQTVKDTKVQTQPSNPKPIIQSPIIPPPKPVPAVQKPKSNSLFVSKQAPISEQNIFKGQNFRRPNSRLQNQKPQYLMGEKPKSSTKSNRSKRSRASSRGIDVEKKSEKLSESKLQVNQNAQDLSNNFNNKNQNEGEQKNSENMQDNEQQEDDTNSQQEVESQNSKAKQIIFDQSDNPFHLPSFRLSNQRPIQKKNPVESILSNPFIKKAFAHLCKQSYIGGGKTFDQIALSADIMTLNKWMIFCKQFDFVSKLKKKQLVDIFQQCTENKPHMNQKQFLDALIIVQNKMKVDEQDFIRKQICLDSEFAFREKVATFKVSYSGPKTNFFEQSQFKPIDKYYQNLRQQKYQVDRQKQKQIILHQGKFKQDIEFELLERKNQRYLKKSYALNSSLTENNKDNNLSQVYKSNQVHAIQSPYLKFVENKSHLKDNYSSVKNNHELGLSKLNISRKIEPLTYSQLFTQKNSFSTRQFTNEKSILQSGERSSQKMITELRDTKKLHQKSQRQNPQTRTSKNRTAKQIQITKEKSSAKTTSKKPEKAQQTKPQRQWVQEIKNWAEEFDKSQSQESDDILREHLMNEKMKKKNLPEKMDLSRIAQEFRKDQKWLQHADLNDHYEWQRQTQLQATNKKQRFK